MSLSLAVNGEKYTSFIAARVEKSIETLTNAFSFVSTANKDNLFPVRKGDAVTIYADNTLLMTGYVESISVSYAVDTHRIEISGRGILADFFDSSVKTSKEFSGGVGLIAIARTLLNDLGMDSVNIVNNTGTIDAFLDTEIESAGIGQSAFEFIELFARRRQVLLNEAPDGSLMLSRGSTTRAPLRLQNVIGAAKGNNVKAATLQLDDSKRYRQYKVCGQLNPMLQQSSTMPDLISDQSGDATDSAVRSTRYLEINAEEATDAGDAGKRAAWEANIRRSKSLNYTATVQGHTFAGTVLAPNTLISVNDDYCDISSDMLIKSVEYNYDLGSGSQTTVNCVQKDAYTLEAEQNQRDASTSKSGDGFI